MEHIFSSTPPASAAPDEDIVVENHEHYYKILFRAAADPNVWFGAYLVRVTDDTVAAVACWERQFDQVFEKFADPKYGEIWEQEFRTTWPTFFQLIDSAVGERYEEGALTEFSDLDDSQPKWFVAALVGSSDSAAEVDERHLKAIDHVVQVSITMSGEFEKPLSWKQKARVAMRGGAVGYREGKAMVGPWEDRLSWLQALSGG